MSISEGGLEVPVVSAVVTTRNSDRTLERCLSSLRAQRGVEVESIVVDNGSSDRTLEIAHRLADVVVQRGPERSAQRNAGVRAGRGEFVAVLDSDMILEPDVLREAVELLARARAVAVPEISFWDGLLGEVQALRTRLLLERHVDRSGADLPPRGRARRGRLR